MRDVFSSDIRIKNIACIEHSHFLDAIHSEVHVYDTIHDGKNFLPIVDVPLIGLVCPMQLDCGAV